MIFSSLVFLCVFLPVVFILYYLMPNLAVKNALLIVVSLFFYAYGEPIYVLLMIASTIINYLFGRWIAKNHRKIILMIAVTINVLLLVVFKYADFLVGIINSLGFFQLPLPGLSLPIGISFYTFQAISYVVDVYRGEVEEQKNYFNILLYMTFFPHLVAGPIVKYHDIKEQIVHRKADVPTITMGMRRFIVGLSKKILIANTVAVAVDGIFSAQGAGINIYSAWLGGIAYLIQVYFDFSGYSDMAIGLAHMFGFTFQENFNYPYVAESIKEFWRRWHISLSTWFKEYLYIPLGGNRKGKFRTLLNKMIVFFCTGLWHGANWTFIVWGLWHGAFQIFEGLVNIEKVPRVFRHLYTLLVVLIGFVLFRADTLAQGLFMIKQMFTGFQFTHLQMAILSEQLSPTFLLGLVLGVIFSCPIVPLVKAKVHNQPIIAQSVNVLSYAGSVVLLVICMLSLSSGAYNPFIYLRF